ncbi:monocarboxylate transporter 12-B-like [Patiria miniata]|uniref:Major facilitator superfamily (MFS) profile domain-containing protein n=1 Tax=Patiria miniata TaxID=46514 RepID=A0A914ANC7_PATMI|nr:monocarboxylate transporter 12-B-like [Patiria miniata]
MLSSDSEARHWPVVLAGFLTVTLTAGLGSSIGIFYLEWLHEFPQSSALVGWLSSSVMAMILGFSSVAAALGKYFGIRRVVVAGAGLSFIGFVGASFAWEFYLLVITIPFMTGIGCSMCYTSVMTIIGDCFHRHFALAFGISMSGVSVGMVSFPVLGGFLIEQYGWRGALVIIGAIQANIVVCAKFMKPFGHTQTRLIKSEVAGGAGYGSLTDPPSLDSAAGGEDYEGDDDDDRPASLSPNRFRFSRGYRNTDAKGEETKAAQERKWSRKLMQFLDRAGVSLIWTNRVFAGILLIPLPMSAGNGITLPFIAARAESVGVPRLRATSLLSIIGVANVIGSWMYGPLVDANVIEPTFILTFAAGMTVVSGFITAVNESYGGFVVCAALFGFASGVYVPLSGVLVRRIIGQERFPGGMGIVLALVAIGYIIFSSVGGYLYDATHSYSGCFYLVGASAALGVVVLLGLHLLWTRLVPDDRWPTIKSR